MDKNKDAKRPTKTFDIIIGNHHLKTLFYAYEKETSKFHSWDDLFAKFGFLLSSIALLASDVNIWIFNDHHFNVLSGAGVVISMWSIYKYYKRKKSDYSIHKLYDNIVDESGCALDKEYRVIFILKRDNNHTSEYLVFDDKIWDCQLFPSVVYNPNCPIYDEVQMKTLKNAISSQIGINKDYISLSELDFDLSSRKFNKSRRCETDYCFKFCYVTLNNFTKEKKSELKSFDIDGIKYSWCSFHELENNPNNMEFNSDVIQHLISKEDNLLNIPYSFTI